MSYILRWNTNDVHPACQGVVFITIWQEWLLAVVLLRGSKEWVLSEELRIIPNLLWPTFIIWPTSSCYQGCGFYNHVARVTTCCHFPQGVEGVSECWVRMTNLLSMTHFYSILTEVWPVLYSRTLSNPLQCTLHDLQYSLLLLFSLNYELIETKVATLKWTIDYLNYCDSQ